MAKEKESGMSGETSQELVEAIAEMQSLITKRLFRIGDDLSEREGYLEHIGMDAVHFYLVQKHHWPPSQVKAMSPEDLEFLMIEEAF